MLLEVSESDSMVDESYADAYYFYATYSARSLRAHTHTHIYFVHTIVSYIRSFNCQMPYIL